MTKSNKSTYQNELDQLIEVVSKLRDPEEGCNWDKEQTFDSLINYTLEEVYEVIDAIKSKNTNNIIEELGDLLFQIIFYSQIAKEKKLFDFYEIAKRSKEKMIRRHPHIFEEKNLSITKDQLKENWERIKNEEKNIDPSSPIIIDNYKKF